MTTRKDRFIAKLVSFLARAVYRDIEVYWAQPMAPDSPQLSVSNHFGGFSDALVLLDVFPRRPGIVARDVIWKVPIVGGLMNWIGGIPVHKPKDKGSATSNDEMFASCYRALDGGGRHPQRAVDRRGEDRRGAHRSRRPRTWCVGCQDPSRRHPLRGQGRQRGELSDTDYAAGIDQIATLD